MEILKNVILALHIIGVAALLGGVLYQMGSARRGGTPRVLPAMIHGAWTMLVTGIALVGLQYPLGNEVNNVKITVKLVVPPGCNVTVAGVCESRVRPRGSQITFVAPMVRASSASILARECSGLRPASRCTVSVTSTVP